jgi:DNA invertase Pin-like site-specific DNA recombinase
MPAINVGYCRVSSEDQNESRQIDAFRAVGIDDRHIFIDKQSGKDFNRNKYIAAKGLLREGDNLWIDSISRFGRNKDEIKKEWEEIVRQIKANIIVMDMPILDTRKYKDGIEQLVSDIVLQLLSYFAEQDRLTIKRQQVDGIAAAKKRGMKFGRPRYKLPLDFAKVARDVVVGKVRPVDAMRQFGMSSATFYRYLKGFRIDKT